MGYLLSIESNSHFDETMMQFLQIASRLISKILAYSALEKGTGLNTSVECVLLDCLEGNISRRMLMDCLRYSQFRIDANYYLLLIDIQHYKVADGQMALKNELQAMFRNQYLSAIRATSWCLWRVI